MCRPGRLIAVNVPHWSTRLRRTAVHLLHCSWLIHGGASCFLCADWLGRSLTWWYYGCHRLLLLPSSLAIYRFHRHGGASGLCVADLGTAVRVIFAPLASARCASTSLVAGWMRWIYHHRWTGFAGDMLSCQLLGLHRWFGCLHCRG